MPQTKGMVLSRRMDWVKQEAEPSLKGQKKWVLLAQTAMGHNGTIEDKLLRLMVWSGAILVSLQKHSRILPPLAVLEDGTGWCDQQVRVFLFFAYYLLGLDAREVDIGHVDGFNRHTVGEVFYDGAWHLFDVHGEHCAVYRDPATNTILDYDGICANVEVVRQENHWWKGNNGVGKEGFYLEPGRRKNVPRKIHEYLECFIPWL